MSADDELFAAILANKDFARYRGAPKRALEQEGFLCSLLFEDVVDDWLLARDLGEYLVLVYPDLLVGHLILAKACRHLSDSVRALQQIARCREIIASGGLPPVEMRLLAPVVDGEARLLSVG